MQATVGTTPVRLLLSSAMRGKDRRDLTVRNMGSARVYIGLTKQVAVGGPNGGFPVDPGQVLDDLDLAGGVELWAVCESTSLIAAECFDPPAPGSQ